MCGTSHYSFELAVLTLSLSSKFSAFSSHFIWPCSNHANEFMTSMNFTRQDVFAPPTTSTSVSSNPNSRVISRSRQETFSPLEHNHVSSTGSRGESLPLDGVTNNGAREDSLPPDLVTNSGAPRETLPKLRRKNKWCCFTG